MACDVGMWVCRSGGLGMCECGCGVQECQVTMLRYVRSSILTQPSVFPHRGPQPQSKTRPRTQPGGNSDVI